MPVRRIPVDSLKVGMYVAGFDRSWLTTSFLTHSFLLKSRSQIEKLKQSGIHMVDIDPAQGLDVDGGNVTTDPAADRALDQSPADAPASPPAAGSPQALGAELARARAVREELLQAVSAIFENIGSSAIVKNQAVKQVVTQMIPKVLESPAAFMALIRTRELDPALREHVLAVSTLAVIVGQALGYEEKRLSQLATGALLHDVGMLRLPSYMLRLSKTLSKSERELYETHPRLGVSLLQKSGGFHTDILRMVSEHHIHLDQSGYPQDAVTGRPGELSQIVLMADRYDEMLTGQLGVAPMPSREVLSVLYQSARNGHTDMHLVSTLIRVVGVYPLYSLVALNTGDRGVVINVTPGKLHLPIVLLVQDGDGRPYTPPIPLDLAAAPEGSEGRSIEQLLDADKEGVRVEDYLQDRGADLSLAA
jgi:HD-GYP domain-containing protein (c-di-GMP phosphodiesterase class II)